MADKFIFFDESGQTYYNYLDPLQTHLAYGGLHTTDTEAGTIKAKYFSRIQADELHYVRLAKNGNGQFALKEFFGQERDWIRSHYKWFLIDKRYGLLAKYVDLLIEPEVADLGENLYSSGGSQKLVFLIHHLAKVHGREEDISRLMTSFNAFYRKPDADHLADLEKIAHEVSTGHTSLDKLLRMPFIRSGSKLLGLTEPAHLDLSFTAAFTLADLWYRELGHPYFLIHDQSQVLSSQEEIWKNLTQERIGYQFETVGPHDVATNIPLKDTIFASSEICIPLQLVDVITGVCRALMEWWLLGRPDNKFLMELAEVFPVHRPDWSILPCNDPNDLPPDNQTVDELNKALGRIAERRAM